MILGLFNVNKPPGPTSHDIVRIIRRSIGIRKVGHAGTLDPLANGVLIVGIGQATRLLEYLSSARKQYRAVIRLGQTTTTYDAEGEVTSQVDVPPTLGTADLMSVLGEKFVGEIQQVPPVYSSIKIAGRTAHARTRSGETVVMEARPVSIYQAELVSYTNPLVTLDIECSSGTYVRSLAHDFGAVLGVGGMLESLTRTASGHFRVEEATPWNTLRNAFDSGSWRDYVIPPERSLEDRPVICLNHENHLDFLHGRLIVDEHVVQGFAAAIAPDGQFAGVLEGDPEQGAWRPRKVFTYP